ncbi:LysR family transcriptional regulator [bacterium]|nr:LysR family transcriptional regulator [bacterium]
MYKVKSKIWIEKDGELVFGDGKYELLRAIKSEGSISKASRRVGMSYRKAWGYVKAIEERLDIKLIERKKGGIDGGESFLTKEGETFLKKYEEFRQGLNEYVDKKFISVFKFKNK